MRYALSKKTSAIIKVNKETRKVEHVMDLPGAGDTAFPSIICLDKHRFLVANYTSPINHQKRDWLMGQLGKTKIYFQVITFAPCNLFTSYSRRFRRGFYLEFLLRNYSFILISPHYLLPIFSHLTILTHQFLL